MKKRKLLCTAEQTDVGGGFSCPLYLYLHLAQGQGAERCVLKMHVSSLIWAVSFGSVSSLLKGTQMALHDLVNLSWDYLLNTNKQTKKKKKKLSTVSAAAPLTCSVCSSLSPFGGNNGILLFDVYLIA